MDRCERAAAYHARGWNCCQSVLAAFSDRTGLDEEASFRLGRCFAGGAGAGELCGAVSGALMVLGLAAEAGADLAESRRRDSEAARNLQRRFSEAFGALRCRELLKRPPNGKTPAALRLGLTNHCRIMVATAVEITEELLGEPVPK